MTKTRSALEWLAIVIVSLAVAAGAIALLSGYFTGRDTPGLTGSSTVPGVAIKDMRAAHLRPGQLRDLARGDIMLLYGSPAPPGGLERLAPATAAPFTPRLAAAGQAVILARRPGVPGVVGLAWGRLIHVPHPDAPALRQFIQYWLGKGAPAR